MVIIKCCNNSWLELVAPSHVIVPWKCYNICKKHDLKCDKIKECNTLTTNVAKCPDWYCYILFNWWWLMMLVIDWWVNKTKYSCSSRAVHYTMTDYCEGLHLRDRKLSNIWIRIVFDPSYSVSSVSGEACSSWVYDLWVSSSSQSVRRHVHILLYQPYCRQT